MNENQKIFLTIVVVLLLVLIFVKIRDGGITGASVATNIKQAAPTPSSCTPTQNCGSSSCGVASGRGGGCGCGG